MSFDSATGAKLESLVRGILAFVLLVAVAWAYAHGMPAAY